MKHGWFVLLLALLSGSISAVAEESLSPLLPPSKRLVVPPYYTQTKPYVPPEPVYECDTESMHAATPTADFTDNRDGTVTHKRSGLVWMRCALGQNWENGTCTGKANKYPWKKALQAVPNFNTAGGYANHAGWRLPNIKELDSIVETQCLNPAINLEVFPATPPFRFWTSTHSITHKFGYAWHVDFQDGYVDDGRTWAVFEGDEEPDTENGRFSYHVRLVRDGQPMDSFYAKPPQPPRNKKK